MYSDKPVPTTGIRAALIDLTNSSSVFFYGERACILETFEYFLEYFHNFYIESLGEHEQIDANDCSQCLSHNIFGFRTEMRGNCCKNYTEPSQQYHLSINGRDLSTNLKYFGKNSTIEMLFGPSIEQNMAYKRYKMCNDCNERFLLCKYLITIPKVLVISIL